MSGEPFYGYLYRTLKQVVTERKLGVTRQKRRVEDKHGWNRTFIAMKDKTKVKETGEQLLV